MKTEIKKNTSAVKRKHIILAVAALLLVIMAARAFRSNPVDGARQLRAQLKDEDLSPEERQEIGKKLRDQVQELSPEQRRELMSDRQKEMAQEMNRFFELSPQEQQQELDKRIDRMVARMQNGPGNGGSGRGGSGGGSGGPGGGGPGGPGQAGFMAGPGGFGGKGASPQQREERRQNMLDNSTPAFRAQMYEYRQMMKERMQERGVQLPAFGPKR